jgi:hypothetical protein
LVNYLLRSEAIEGNNIVVSGLRGRAASDLNKLSHHRLRVVPSSSPTCCPSAHPHTKSLCTEPFVCSFLCFICLCKLLLPLINETSLDPTTVCSRHLQPLTGQPPTTRTLPVTEYILLLSTHSKQCRSLNPPSSAARSLPPPTTMSSTTTTVTAGMTRCGTPSSLLPA